MLGARPGARGIACARSGGERSSARSWSSSPAGGAAGGAAAGRLGRGGGEHGAPETLADCQLRAGVQPTFPGTPHPCNGTERKEAP